MRASVFVSAIAFAVASAQDDSSSIDPAPQTTYLTQTNSLGVVTGMPAPDTSIASMPNAVTSQPAVITTQPVPADIPAVGTGITTLTLAGTGTGSMVNSTRTIVVSANNSTTVALVSTTASGAEATGSGSSDSDATGTDADATGTDATGTGADSPDSTGAASNVKVAAGSLVGFGAFMAAFLHFPSVPYSDPPSRLQTVDVWLPSTSEATNDGNNAIWLVYLHGGAWRDPTQDSHCIEPTLSHLSTSHAATVESLGGIASLNYRLSPHTSHATEPSRPDDTERTARHPQHVRDVAAGIRFLQREYGMKRWIGVGHSCGATLMLQLVAGIGLEDSVSASIQGGPEALILLEGIYNFPLLLRNHLPPTCPQHISDIYKDFISGAFGEDEEKYLAASPVSGKYNAQQWAEGKLLVICHSHADELVERAQRDVMCVALDREGWSIVMEVGDEEDEVKAEGRRVLNVRDLKGGHDWIWEDGKQIATLIAEVVQRLA
ncbi:alpha beta-hydrolase [Stemphylium lycopersici]|uniref:Kynurenine formamidase n=1 Tax=Stemphylium lycopersici TaxID=183478 RepID=A0A364N4M7_STELY|nr:alpha beta-hydrolase [Stemphylium lycopersici]RAR11154.1 alpha beta-hydrolase [Stemphylium lycopersici]